MNEQPPQVPITVNLTVQECMTTMNVLKAFASSQNAATMRAIADVLERFEIASAEWQKQNSPIQFVEEEPLQPLASEERPDGEDNHAGDSEEVLQEA